MKSGSVLFGRLILRRLVREPVRTGLTVFAVALGVAVVIAIDLAGQAAAGSFHSSLESLTGNSDLIITETGGLDEKLLGRLIQLPYAFEFAPRIEDFASINGKGESLPLIGVDLIGQRAEHDVTDVRSGKLLEQLTTGDAIWVGESLGFRRGAHLKLLVNDAMLSFTVAGVLRRRRGEVGESRVIVMDIGLAQKVTRRIGKIDSIEVRIPPDHSLEYWRKLLGRELPPSIMVSLRGARTDENRKMLAAFRSNLRVLSYIALIVGAFLIYNTISISVVRRRNEIGVVRALGATRSAIRNGFIAEALLFAVAGGLCGLVIGRAMAIAAVRLISDTVESLYVSSHPAPIALSLAPAVTGVAVAMVVAVVAALAPAIEASQVAPTEAMARGREQHIASVRSRRTVFWAIGALLAAGGLSQLPAIDGQPIFAYAAVLLLIGGTAMLIPNIVTFFVAIASRVLENVLGVEALLALRSLRSSIGRTSVLTAALATAVAMAASVGIMVGSFRETVWLWMNDELRADLYLRPAGSSAADRHPTMSAEIADKIERLPHVAAVDRFRAYPISYDGLPATLAGGETRTIQTSASTRFLPGENRDEILSKLPTGDYAVVSEPFANKHSVRAGSTLHLPLAGVIRKVQVLGIYYDYSTERGFIVLDRNTLLKYLPDRAASNLAVYLKPGADSNEVRRQIGELIGGRNVMMFPNSALRGGAIEVFDRTFRITYALEAVAVIVAIMGIAGALVALVIDRRREFALLRFLGGAQPQIRRVILCEAGLLGLLANAIGLVLGTLLSLILIFVINKQSFGWTIQFHWPVALLFGVLTSVYIATALAGLYPARIATRMHPIEVIHEE
jgi:putative ABC transport system permease protein